MKTSATKKSAIKRNWYLFDAQDKVLGRLASEIVILLIGKNKVYYSPNLDCGDYVVVVNAEKIKVSGKKASQKKYIWHTGFPKGLRELSYQQMLEKNPKNILRQAVDGMLPKNKLRDLRIDRLKIFIGKNHIYQDKFKKE